MAIMPSADKDCGSKEGSSYSDKPTLCVCVCVCVCVRACVRVYIYIALYLMSKCMCTFIIV